VLIEKRWGERSAGGRRKTNEKVIHMVIHRLNDMDLTSLLVLALLVAINIGQLAYVVYTSRARQQRPADDQADVDTLAQEVAKLQKHFRKETMQRVRAASPPPELVVPTNVSSEPLNADRKQNLRAAARERMRSV